MIFKTCSLLISKERVTCFCRSVFNYRLIKTSKYSRRIHLARKMMPHRIWPGTAWVLKILTWLIYVIDMISSIPSTFLSDSKILLLDISRHLPILRSAEFLLRACGRQLQLESWWLFVQKLVFFCNVVICLNYKYGYFNIIIDFIGPAIMSWLCKKWNMVKPVFLSMSFSHGHCDLCIIYVD